MDLNKLLSFIPVGLLAELAIETKVDHYAKKLQGEVIFKLLLHCLISHKNNSLRTMESAYESIAFQLLNKEHNTPGVRYSSISERLSVMKASYFEKIYLACVNEYKESLMESKKVDIIRFDSTIVSLSSALINIGYNTGGDSLNHKQLKFTVGFTEIPEVVNFYHHKSYTSENKALKESILKQPNNRQQIKIFDRGITSRDTYDSFSDYGIAYISRIDNNARNKPHKANSLKKPVNTASLKIISDSWVNLYASNDRQTKHAVRFIQAIRKDDDEKISFITNISDLSTATITELYKRRWDIEVFFKFLKQELNFKHFINRSENGIQVTLYVTMVAAILLMVYKMQNKLSGFKIVKQKFAQELEKEIIKHLITLCGGDSSQLAAVLGRAPT